MARAEPQLDANFAFASSHDQNSDSDYRQCDSGPNTSPLPLPVPLCSDEPKPIPASLWTIFSLSLPLGSCDPTTLNSFNHLTCFRPLNDDEMRFNKPVVLSCNKQWREVATVQNIANKQITPAHSDSSPDFSHHHRTYELDLLPLGFKVSMDDCLGTSESFMEDSTALKNHISYECISDSSSQVSYDGKEKEGFKNVPKNKASLIGMASLHLAEYVFTVGVKMPGLNSTYKADPTQCSQAARRNVTDRFDPKFVGPGVEAVCFVYKKLISWLPEIIGNKCHSMVVSALEDLEVIVLMLDSGSGMHSFEQFDIFQQILSRSRSSAK